MMISQFVCRIYFKNISYVNSFVEYISSFVVSYTLLSMGFTLNSLRYRKNAHMDYTLHLYYTLETH